MKTLAAILLLTTSLACHAAATCNARAYGAKGNGATLDTEAIQKAIDACAKNPHGGGVILSGGTFLSAPLTLRSHVNLIIQKDAILQATTDLNAFPLRTEKEYNWRRVALLHADNADGIAITGGGIVDGAGQVWWDYARKTRVAGDTTGSGANHARPLLVDITRSHDITIAGITFRNSPMYNLTFFQSTNILISHVTILNPATGAPNTDGIDAFYSHNIDISNSTIDTGDDCIALKSGLVERGEPNEPTTNVHIHNLTLLHGHGLSIGSETAGGLHNIFVENITFRGTDAGIRIKSNRTRGNDISNIHYENITMQDVETPILITEYYPKIPATDTAQPMDAHTPRFHDITIKNLKATGAKTAMTIAGLPESPIKNLQLDDVSISAKTGATIRNANIQMHNVVITPESGPAITKGPNVEITEK